MQTPEEFVEIIRKIEHKERWDSEDGIIANTDFSIGNKDAVELVRARDAEIRRECAERAITWLKTLHHEPEPGLPWSEKIKRMQELQMRTLRAAIIGEE